ncbi:MAG TPA: hypothetical protein VKH42_21155, partial [Vicinamibacterales bacterium]|nr:hypothetical protein [Vicinamibacterales bacterium]
INERQNEISRLDAVLAEFAEPLHQRLAIMPGWVRQQLEDTAGLLSERPERTKQEFRRLALRVTMTPQQTSDARRYYRADVVNSLPCLSGSVELRNVSPSAVDRSDPRARW